MSRQSLAPHFLEPYNPFDNRAEMKFRYGTDVGDCQCAEPHLQISPWSSGNWTTIGGTCSDPAYRHCYFGPATGYGLEADTVYQSRLQVKCLDPALSSDFFYAVEPLVTLPPCRFTESSGRSDDFKCADGSFCDGVADESCCNAKGGILHCPDSTPTMCAEKLACAGGQDFCCRASNDACAPFGGRLECSVDYAPSRVPVILDYASYQQASLTLTWNRGVYPSGKKSPCDYLQWRVEIKLATADWAEVSADNAFIASCAALKTHEQSCKVFVLLVLLYT